MTTRTWSSVLSVASRLTLKLTTPMPGGCSQSIPMTRAFAPASTRTMVFPDAAAPSRGSVWTKFSARPAVDHSGSSSRPSMTWDSPSTPAFSRGAAASSWPATPTGNSIDANQNPAPQIRRKRTIAGYYSMEPVRAMGRNGARLAPGRRPVRALISSTRR